MHDTHLIEKIYQSIVGLCAQHKIIKVSGLKIEVDPDSHIDGPHLLSHLIDRDNLMFDNNTVIQVVHKPYQKLTAVIAGIEGESLEQP